MADPQAHGDRRQRPARTFRRHLPAAQGLRHPEGLESGRLTWNIVIASGAKQSRAVLRGALDWLAKASFASVAPLLAITSVSAKGDHTLAITPARSISADSRRCAARPRR